MFSKVTMYQWFDKIAYPDSFERRPDVYVNNNHVVVMLPWDHVESISDSITDEKVNDISRLYAITLSNGDKFFIDESGFFDITRQFA